MKLRWWNFLAVSVVAAMAVAGFWLPFSKAQQDDPNSNGGTAAMEAESFANKLVLAALDRLKHRVRYDPAYVVIDYPNGDVPADTGVCTDVVVRSYRKLGIDLQKLVHEDMRANFSKYPKNWGLKSTDRHIDHRRVPNLQKFFTRHGESLEVSKQKDNYLPGDLVAWDLNGKNLWHIGIVVGPDKFVHNIGGGPVLDSGIFEWEVVGHYRYHPAVPKHVEGGAPFPP